MHSLMQGIILLKHTFVLLLVFAGAIFLAMGASSILDSAIFGVLFLGLGSYLVYLAVKLNRLDEFASKVRVIYEKKAEITGIMILVATAILINNMTIGWLLLWPLWGTQPVVYMASVFVDGLIPFDAGIVFYGLSLAFEGVYLYFISNKTVSIIRIVSRRLDTRR